MTETTSNAARVQPIVSQLVGGRKIESRGDVRRYMLKDLQRILNRFVDEKWELHRHGTHEIEIPEVSRQFHGVFQSDNSAGGKRTIGIAVWFVSDGATPVIARNPSMFQTPEASCMGNTLPEIADLGS